MSRNRGICYGFFLSLRQLTEVRFPSLSICLYNVPYAARPVERTGPALMNLHVTIGVLIFVATLAIIMVRPSSVSEAVAAADGAVLILLGGYVRPGEAASLHLASWK